MIAPVERATSPWNKPAETAISAPKTVFLKDTVCCLDRGAMVCRFGMPSEPVIQALNQLVTIVMQMKSPMGGWPADLEQTPENLADYVSEEVWEFLDALDGEDLTPSIEATDQETVMVPVAELIPHLLWLLASSNYEVMRLLEGVRSRIYTTETQFSLSVVRLVPILNLRLGETDYALDLVTQAEPDPALYITDAMAVKLVENDLDDQPMAVPQMLNCLSKEIGQTKPQLLELLGAGWATKALSPFQTWEEGTLTLQLHLANMGERSSNGDHRPDSFPLPEQAQPSQEPSGSVTESQTATSGFTLDDFADVLEVDTQVSTQGILGDWITFTDEAWVHNFLNSCACEIMLQHLPILASAADRAEQDRELACINLVYGATTLVQGDQALSKHTFVHEPVLMADLWLRLRWYLAHCSERVMQLMGGMSCRVLVPGRGWQQGYVYLRPVMALNDPGACSEEEAKTEQRLWMLDLGSGRLLPTMPSLLPDDAVITVMDAPSWQLPSTVGALSEHIAQDIADYTPAINALRQRGTPVNVHCLESAEELQGGQLKLDWGLTLQPRL